MSNLMRDIYIQTVVKDIENEMNQWFYGEKKMNEDAFYAYHGGRERTVKATSRYGAKSQNAGQWMMAFGQRLRQSLQHFF